MDAHEDLYSDQSMERGRSRFEIVFPADCAPPAVPCLPGCWPFSLFDFCLLQIQWASCRLSGSEGWPPRSIGMMWSIDGLMGWGYFRLLSTGFPQIPQTLHVARIVFFARSNASR